jgi:tetratricopeptide (TPR) repeat protein
VATTRTTRHDVDEWTAGWRLARRAACHAEVTVRAARVGCLDRQLTLLRAQVAQWATADGEAADAAIAAAAALPPTADCSFAVAAPPPPSLAPLLTRIAELTAMQRAGHVAQARPLVDALLADAERAANPAVLAQARAAAAGVVGAGGDPRRAHELYLRAADSAATAGDELELFANLLGAAVSDIEAGHPREALAALDTLAPVTARSHVDGYAGSLELRRGQALTIAGDPVAAAAPLARAVDLAQARAAREPGHDDDLALALVLQASGHLAAHEYPAARTLYTRALAIQETIYGPDHPTVARTLHDLATVEYTLDDPAAGRAHYARALDILTRTYGPDHPLLARLHLSAGENAANRGDLDGARAEFELALTGLARTLPPDDPDFAIANLGIAAALRNQSRCADALPYFARGLAILTRAHKGGPQLAQAEVNLGGCQLALERLPEATETLRAAITEFERAGLHGDDLAEPLTNLAAIAERKGHMDEARELMVQALAAIGEPTDTTRALHDELTKEVARLRKPR